MNRWENKRLLSEILADETDAGFRDVLLGRTLHLAKRRRQFRRARQIAYTCIVFMSLALIGVHFLGPKPPSSARPVPAYTLVVTRPLARSAIVETQPDASAVVVNSASLIATVTTSSVPQDLHRINDDELLALLPSPALLIRRGPDSADLVFADPRDTEAPLRN
jgi:hypothetical protein